MVDDKNKDIQPSGADEIDKLIQEFKEGKLDITEEESKKTEQPDEAKEIEEILEKDEKVEEVDIDKLVEEVKSETQEETAEAQEDKTDDVIDQILSELESGLMGKDGKGDTESYKVLTAKDIKERSDLEEIISKLESKLEEIPVENETYRLELVALIESLKTELQKRKEKEEGRVIEKLYKVTRETEEETVKLMEKIETAMDVVNECIEIVNGFEKNEKTVELLDKLNYLNDILFDSINQLQFQDITRQKIERVIAALKKLNDYLNEWFGTDFIGD